MLVTESVTFGKREFIHNYSDAGLYIERDGVEYIEAYDPADSGRTYTETDHLIPTEEELEEEETQGEPE